ncbi:MAG TPA: hypothetical protein VIL78_02890 [Hanamia sp.]
MDLNKLHSKQINNKDFYLERNDNQHTGRQVKKTQKKSDNNQR